MDAAGGAQRAPSGSGGKVLRRALSKPGLNRGVSTGSNGLRYEFLFPQTLSLCCGESWRAQNLALNPVSYPECRFSNHESYTRYIESGMEGLGPDSLGSEEAARSFMRGSLDLGMVS